MNHTPSDHRARARTHLPPARIAVAWILLHTSMVLTVTLPSLQAAATEGSNPASSHHQVELDPEALERAGVVVTAVRLETFGDPLPVIGRIVRAPGATVEIKSILEGRVDDIHVAPGDRVRAEDPVVTLHSHALHRLQGDLLKTHEALRLAENRVAAGRELLALEGISLIEFERRKQVELRARIDLDSLIAELADLGYRSTEIEALIAGHEQHPTLTIRAPTGGVVLHLAVQQHAWVQRHEALVTIGDPARLELELQIPPAEAPSVSRGDRVRFAPVGQRDLQAEAEVITPVPSVDPMTRTVTIRARITSDLSRMLDGVYIEGTIERGEEGDVLTVAETAVIRIDRADHVFVRRAEGVFEARPVTLGRFAEAGHEVIGGLAVGEEVAIAGVFLLKSALLRGLEE